MNLQVTLIVIGIVVILAIYVISRIVEWKRTQEEAMHLKKPAAKSRLRNPFRRKKRSGFSSGPGKKRSNEIEPNFGEDSLAFMAETEVVFGVDSDDANDRQLRPDEIENLTAPDIADSIPVLSQDEVAGRYHADRRDAPQRVADHERPDSGDGGSEPPSREERQPAGMATGDESINESGVQGEVKAMETDEVASALGAVERESAQGQRNPDSSDSLRDGASHSFQYPEIEGFIRISQIDYWIKLTGKRDVGRESALALYREESRPLGKQHRIFGRKVPQGEWRALELEVEDARFGDLIITLQLADKDGAVGKEELEQFVALAKTLAKGIDYEFTLMAPVDSALKQGQAIADFIRHYDSLSIIHVQPGAAGYFDGATVNRCATQLGLDHSPEGFFVRNQLVNRNKTNLYYMANMSKSGEFDFDNIKDTRIPGVIFFTKPVLHRSPGVVYMEMADTAKVFAARIKGNAKPPDHDTLSQSYVDKNRALIEKTARKMEELGIAPGNEEAMRLF